MKKIAVFASGSGTNAENFIKYFKDNQDIIIDAIYCNVKDAYVLKRAEKYNIPSFVFSRSEMKDPEILLKVLQSRGTDFIVLAGFMWLLPPCMVNAYVNKIVNIHPSLLPKYGGKGMHGDLVHQAVVAARETESGITIHYVNEDYDAGDIIIQKTCPVYPTDTPERVAIKVHELEYKYYPCVVEDLIKKL